MSYFSSSRLKVSLKPRLHYRQKFLNLHFAIIFNIVLIVDRSWWSIKIYEYINIDVQIILFLWKGFLQINFNTIAILICTNFEKNYQKSSSRFYAYLFIYRQINNDKILDIFLSIF